MRFIKLGVISLVVLFLVITAIGLAFPSTVTTSRMIEINASPDSLYHYLADMKYWKLWMKGAEENTIQFLSKKTAGAGTVAKIGTNEVSIQKATPGSIETIWKGEKGNIMTSGFVMMKNTRNNATVVQWYFQKHLGWYPWQRFGAMFNDKVLGPVMEASLTDLKKLAEHGE